MKIRRELAGANPAVYNPDVATTLNNLAILVQADGGRRNKAEGYFQEALKIRRELAKANPSVFISGLVNTLGGFGDTQLHWGNPSQNRKPSRRNINPDRNITA